MIGNFLLHQWLNKNLSTTGAFEIYYDDDFKRKEKAKRKWKRKKKKKTS